MSIAFSVERNSGMNSVDPPDARDNGLDLVGTGQPLRPAVFKMSQ